MRLSVIKKSVFISQSFFIAASLLFISACNRGPTFHGSVRDLMPAQAGNFKLRGEVKKTEIPPEGKYQEGALHPTEGADAQYESAGGVRLALQVVNYPSAAEAGEAWKQMLSNVEGMKKEAIVEQGEKMGKEGRAVGRRMVVRELTPGVNQVIWTNGSLFYIASGAKLDALLEFEKSLPV